ncbi:hypothetical protein SARC_11065 [Sphaeroforma arctica JP610]|uniref:Uncharacterized protein n=1 Tax=Sphaeroforma arctica JP610 TaxID=667725 RepID=A0A0L0FI19_9EUKA|nr:hypothetical protein SARC_11065 [Sphaeroforma arctica JP610]KNC76437.1 hypothetical protein SARC_11065 [Sphaeroforma arctica JP610]|eukprot:XP_014150339.1 hypothetical protein SARC_11065 [Sphaeroforma arctica JP610]
MAKYLHMRCPTPTSIHSNSHGNTPSRKAPFTPGIGDETNETTRNTEAIVHKKSVSHKRNESLSDRKDVLKISKCGSTTPQRKKSVKGRISSAVRVCFSLNLVYV